MSFIMLSLTAGGKKTGCRSDPKMDQMPERLSVCSSCIGCFNKGGSLPKDLSKFNQFSHYT